jgi:hypothetical protein
MKAKPGEKLPFFIETFPDELWYSVIARLRERLNYGWHTFCEVAYGTVGGARSITLPAKFGRFVENLPAGSGLDPAQLIESYTLLPFYRPFISEARFAEAQNQMIVGPYGARIVSTPAFNCLNFCPACRDQDVRQGIPPYWRRSHQIPHVDMCHRHEVPLFSCTEEVNPNRTAVCLSEVGENFTPAQRGNSYQDIRADYAKTSSAILNSKHRFVSHGELLARYQRVLATKQDLRLHAILDNLAKDIQNSPAFSALRFHPPEESARKLIYRTIRTGGRGYGANPARDYVVCKALGKNLLELLNPASAFETDDRREKHWKVVNWKNRDEVLSNQVRTTDIRPQALSERPLWVSRLAVLTRLKLPTTDKVLRNLPLTIQAITERVESKEAYARRMISWTAHFAPLDEVGYIVSRYQFKFRFINNGVKLDESLLRFVEEAWDALTQRRQEANWVRPPRKPRKQR